MELQDKVVIVTGSARGIGAEYAHAFAKQGYQVLVADISDAQGTADGLIAMGTDAMAIQVDLRSREQADSMVEAAIQRWGRVDVLVNNAARYAGLYRGPLETIPSEEWDDVMSVNVRGLWNASAAALGSMREQGAGAIVNISSSTALKGTPYNLHYVASKGAVLAMTRAMARELGSSGIRVNCVTPGLVDNEASREGREAEFEARVADRARERSLSRDMYPPDLVGAVLFLASDASGFITGQNLTVDGGTIFN